MPESNNEALIGRTPGEKNGLPKPESDQIASAVLNEELNPKKEEGLQKKIRYWTNYQRYFFEKDQYGDNFELRLWKYYKLRQDGIIEKKYEYIGKMEWDEKENYIEEYLRDYYLYGQDTKTSEWLDINELSWFFKRDRYTYENLRDSNVELKPYDILDAYSKNLSANQLDEILEKFNFQEWMILNLINNRFGDEWFKNLMKKFSTIPSWATLNLWLNNIGEERAEDIPEITIWEWASLDLQKNKIGNEWIKALSKKLKLKVWANISLYDNNIWDDGAEAIANLNFDYWVTINLGNNKIKDAWADYIMKNMKLKQGMHLDLSWNNLSDEKKNELKQWENSYHKQW